MSLSLQSSGRDSRGVDSFVERASARCSPKTPAMQTSVKSNSTSARSVRTHEDLELKAANIEAFHEGALRLMILRLRRGRNPTSSEAVPAEAARHTNSGRLADVYPDSQFRRLLVG